MKPVSLKEYREKRSFQRTPEPKGEAQAGNEGPLRFVVQKHQASHMHYDFRLELEGVLLSWAVPKGPSMIPGHKKLAMRTEDHPLEYQEFEGIIPEGEYGGGTVMIWDRGTYHAPGKESRRESEPILREGLQEGNLKFVLEGEKLKGEFALVRMKNQEKESWLLIKKDDRYATAEDVLVQDRSVITGATIEEIREREKESEEPRVWRSQQTDFDLSGIDLEGALKGKKPDNVEPMLATLAEEPFNRQGWIFELKWDGFRAIGESGSSARLYSRTSIDYAKEFNPLVEELGNLPFTSVLDGEVVVVDENGKADFKLLQNYRKTGQGLLVYYVFDVLYLEGYDLRRIPLQRRKSILREVLPPLPRIKYSDHIEEQGIGLFKQAVKAGVEGIIAKDLLSLYRPGVRSKEWLKIKAHQRQEAVIGGFTEPRGSRSNLGALLLGVFEDGKLNYVGHTGGGFEETDLVDVFKILKPLAREESPFNENIKTNAPPTWVKPELVCEVRFTDWTQDGLMRHPIYLGLREDKSPHNVKRELPIPTIKALERRKRIQLGDRGEKTVINGYEVTITNPNKIYFPDDVITKGEVIQYYREIAPFILPYLVDRPESLNRFPNGIQGKSFFQKDINEKPDWVKTVRLDSESQPEGIDYLLCQNEATLVYMANLGCIEINPWNSRVTELDMPDFLIIDLDPDRRTFDEVIKVALETKNILDQIDTPCFVKTSGQSGLHINIPLGAKYLYEQVRQFSSLIVRLVNNLLPEITSVERNPQDRRGKIYLDYLQNRRGQTMAAPYSLRPKRGAPVSTPLHWKELKPGISPMDFHMKNIRKRLEKEGDLWKGVLEEGIDMEKSLGLLKKVWKKS